MTKKRKKLCKTLNYTEHFLILASTITECISISPFAFSVIISIAMKSSGIELKIFAILAGIKKYKSISKKKKKKHDQIARSAKSELNSMEVLISVVIHDEFVFINNVQNECNKIKEEIRNSNKKEVCFM